MSSRPPADSPVRPFEVAIVGNDAVLASLPSRPMQLAHALLACGFDFVVPVSWGEELLAEQALRAVAARGAAPAIFCACPLQHARLLAAGSELVPYLIALVPPVVAAARYLRALHPGSALRITVLGGCPHADDAAIDARIQPLEFLRLLDERGIVLARQPAVFESVIPPDRRRHLSLPGGCPSPKALETRAPERRLVTITEDAFATELAEQLLGREPVFVDVSARLACASCGGFGGRDHRGPVGRDEILRHEPPRTHTAVVDHDVPLALAIDPAGTLPMMVPGAARPVAPPEVQLPGTPTLDQLRQRAERLRLAVTPARAVPAARRGSRGGDVPPVAGASTGPAGGTVAPRIPAAPSAQPVAHAPAEHQPTAHVPVETVAAELTPAELAPAQRPPAERPPADVALADVAPAAVAPVDREAILEVPMLRTVERDGPHAPRAPGEGGDGGDVATTEVAHPRAAEIVVDRPAARDDLPPGDDPPGGHAGASARSENASLFPLGEPAARGASAWLDAPGLGDAIEGREARALAAGGDDDAVGMSTRRRAPGPLYVASRAQGPPRVRASDGKVLPRAYIRHAGTAAREVAGPGAFVAVAPLPGSSLLAGHPASPGTTAAAVPAPDLDVEVVRAVTIEPTSPALSAMHDDVAAPVSAGHGATPAAAGAGTALPGDDPAPVVSGPIASDVLARLRQAQAPPRVVSRDITPPDEERDPGSLAVFIAAAVLVVALLVAIGIVFRRAPTAPW